MDPRRGFLPPSSSGKRSTSAGHTPPPSKRMAADFSQQRKRQSSSSPEPDWDDTTSYFRPVKQTPSVSRDQLVSFLNQNKDLGDSFFLDHNPEKNPEFWEHEDVDRIGELLATRNVVLGAEKQEVTFIRRENGGDMKPSIFRLPSKYLEDFLRNALIPTYNNIINKTAEEIFPPKAIQNHKIEEFWDDESVRDSPRGLIKVRPFIIDEQTKNIYLRLWQVCKPTQIGIFNSNNEKVMTTWYGPTMNLSINQYLGLITLLGVSLHRFWERKKSGDGN
jgi:hypothetical protein